MNRSYCIDCVKRAFTLKNNPQFLSLCGFVGKRHNFMMKPVL